MSTELEDHDPLETAGKKISSDGSAAGSGRLDPTRLIEQALRETGLSQLDDRRFEEPLTRFLEACASEGRLSEVGTLGVESSVVRCVTNRLRMQEDLKRHPEILDEEIVDPIVVIGLPRTGTTKLQRMLSSDPNTQPLWFWRALNPAPFPGWTRDAPDARIAAAEGYVEALMGRPSLIAAHPMGVWEVDEDVFLTEMTFDGLLPCTQWQVPSYEEWVKTRSRHDLYTLEKTLLQYLQWQDGGGRGRPWVLKAVTHLGGVEALAQTFPSAHLVHTHRNLEQSIPSACRTIEEVRALFSDDLDLEELGTGTLDLYAKEMTDYLEQRDRLGSEARVIDIAYSDILNHPMDAISRIYEFAGRELTPQVKERMQQWEQGNPQYKRGRTSYSLERYGLTIERVNEAFAEYRTRFADYMG